MMLQPSLSTTDARGGPPLLGLLDQATHIRTTEHGATWTRTTRSLELRLTAQREMMEDCGSRNGLATFLASGPCHVLRRGRSALDIWSFPGPSFTWQSLQ